MFNRHAILALAAISTEAIKLKESDPWRPTNYLYFEPHPIAGVPSDWLKPFPIAGGDDSLPPIPELSAELEEELAQVVADIKQRQPRMLTQTEVAGRIWC